MQIPESALNPWSSRNGNSLVVIAAEYDTWANYSGWGTELISPDAASYWHNYNPSGTRARVSLIRHPSLLAVSSEMSAHYAVLCRSVRKKRKEEKNYVPKKRGGNEKDLSKTARNLWTLICNSSRGEEDACIHSSPFEMEISALRTHLHFQPSASYLINQFVIMTT